MDPEQALADIRESVAEILAHRVEHSYVSIGLAESFEALDGFLSRGGHVPAAWRGAEMEDHR
jgi:hypothetical protein